MQVHTTALTSHFHQNSWSQDFFQNYSLILQYMKLMRTINTLLSVRFVMLALGAPPVSPQTCKYIAQRLNCRRKPLCIPLLQTLQFSQLFIQNTTENTMFQHPAPLTNSGPLGDQIRRFGKYLNSFPAAFSEIGTPFCASFVHALCYKIQPQPSSSENRGRRCGRRQASSII